MASVIYMINEVGLEVLTSYEATNGMLVSSLIDYHCWQGKLETWRSNDYSFQ
jgi:hypothetical protein